MAADGIADEPIESGSFGDMIDGSIGLGMRWSCHGSRNPVDQHSRQGTRSLVRY